MNAGLWAIGTKFLFEDRGNPGTFLEFPEVINIGWNRGTRENIDLTNHQSTPPFEEFIKGIATGAQIDITFNVTANDPVKFAIQQQLEDEWLQDDPIQYRLIYNDPAETTYTFDGYVSAYNSNHNTRDAHRGSATIACTGAWLRTVGGS